MNQVKKIMDTGMLEETPHPFSGRLYQSISQPWAEDPHKIDKAPKRSNIGNIARAREDDDPNLYFFIISKVILRGVEGSQHVQ